VQKKAQLPKPRKQPKQVKPPAPQQSGPNTATKAKTSAWKKCLVQAFASRQSQPRTKSRKSSHKVAKAVAKQFVILSAAFNEGGAVVRCESAPKRIDITCRFPAALIRKVFQE